MFDGRLFYALAALALLAAAPARADDPVVASLGDHEIKLSGLKPFLAGLDPKTRAEAAANSQVLLALVRAELGRELLLDEARKKQWETRPEIAPQIERARDSVVVSSYLTAMTPLPDGYPSDAEVAAAYDKNRDQLLEPRQYHLAQIFVSRPAGTPDTSQAKAQALAKEARTKGADFAAIVRRSSDEKDGANHDGDLGWLPENRIVPEVLAAVQGMTDNDVSDPIRTEGGWHVVKMLGTKPASVRPLAEVRESLIAYLKQKRKQDEENRYLEDLLAKQQVAVNEIALKQALAAAK